MAKHQITIENHACRRCGELCRNKKVLAWHLRSHSITLTDYLKQHYFPGGPPECACGCGTLTAWHGQSYCYNEYVTGHNTTLKRSSMLEQAPAIVDEEDQHTCLACSRTFASLSKLSAHLQFDHRVTSIDYTIEHVYSGVRPTCAADGCDAETRYVAGEYVFKRYCKKHARLAMKDGGKIGGKLRTNVFKGQTKDTHASLAAMSENMKGDKNPFYGHVHSPKTIEQIAATKRLSTVELMKRIAVRADEWTLLTDTADYARRQGQYLEFECVACKTTKRMTLHTFERGSLCPTCYENSVSIAQKEMARWVASVTGLEPEISTRRVISPQELDVYVERLSVAFEYHGLYFHSSAKKGGHDPNMKRALIRKAQACESLGIKLQQFFDDEWRDKRDICESMMLHAMKMSPMRVDARTCSVREASADEVKAFFEANHIDGYARMQRCWSLMDDEGPVAMLSVRRPQGKKTKRCVGPTIEIARFASRLRCNVRGGLGKLLSVAIEWARANGYKNVLTYADRRFGSGTGYARVGFAYVGDTGPGRCWTDLKRRYGRQKCMAGHPIAGLTERENAEQLDWHTIWTPGSNVYVMEL